MMMHGVSLGVCLGDIIRTSSIANTKDKDTPQIILTYFDGKLANWILATSGA